MVSNFFPVSSPDQIQSDEDMIDVSVLMTVEEYQLLKAIGNGKPVSQTLLEIAMQVIGTR